MRKRSQLPLFLLVALGGALVPTAARADKPFPGVTLVRDANQAMIVADLCEPGVSVRATKYAERKATPEQWATRSDVQAVAAVNADFFDFPGWTKVNGRARGGGEDWPADKQLFEMRHYIAFGPGVATLEADTKAPAAAPAITEIVGAHNVIIQGGVSLGPNFDGDGVLAISARRTAIGLSKDRSLLYLYSSNTALTGAQLADHVLAEAKAAGYPQIDVASNMDGGGSAQMYVKGLGQIITSGRQVNNHLGIYAKGTGDPVSCPNRPPVGYLDGVACDGLTGWAQDPSEPTKTIQVHAYFDGAAGAKGAQAIVWTASHERQDLCKPLGSCNHAFVIPPPLSLFDGKPHEVHLYGIDSSGGRNPELSSSPKTMTCTPFALAGVKRWVHDPTVLAAWHMTAFDDVMTVPDAALDPIPEESPIPDAPTLERSDDGAPEVWLVEGNVKRHVTNPEVAAAWHFDLGTVVVRPAAEIGALVQGADIRPRPVLVRGSGPKVYMVDDSLSATADGGLTGGGGGAGGAGGSGGGAGASGDGGASDDGGCNTAPGGGEHGGAWIAGLVVGALAFTRRRPGRRSTRRG